MIRKSVVAFGTVLTVLTLTQQVKADATEDFVKFFSASCIRTVHDIAQLKAISDLHKWKKLPNKVREAFFPSIADEADGWAVREFGQQFFVGYTIGYIDGRKVTSCAVVGRPHNADEVASILGARFSLKPITDEVEGFQRYQMFSTNVSGSDINLTVLSGDDKKPGPVNLAVQIFEGGVSAPLSTTTRKTRNSGCLLTKEQKAAIRKQMCRSREYSWIKGPDCLKKILHQRAEDTATQVWLAGLCGFNSQANKLKELALTALPHIVKMNECLAVGFDTERVFKNGFEAGKKKVERYGRNCSYKLKSRLRQRLPQLLLMGEQNLKIGKDLNRKLGIQ